MNILATNSNIKNSKILWNKEKMLNEEMHIWKNKNIRILTVSIMLAKQTYNTVTLNI